MSDTRSEIVELVSTLVLPIVDEPESVDIASSDTEDGALLVEVRVSEADAGKVIGRQGRRQGRVIKAIRTLSRAAGSRHGLDVEVELLDD